LPVPTKDLDIRILKELTSPSSFQWNFRESYAEIAKRLRADSETIRITLKRSIESGLINGWRLILNPELFGCKLAGLQLNVHDAAKKSQVISQIKLADGVVQILDFHGTGLRVVLYFENGFALSRKMELIKSICGDKGTMSYWISSLPHCNLRLRNIDWRIIRSVMHDPKKDASVVARQVGVSRRTVNRRLRRMTEEKVAYLIPVRNVKKSKGIICSFLIFCSEVGREAIDEFLKSQPTRVDFIYNSTKDLFILTLVTNNPSETSEFHAQLKNLPGVNEVKMEMLSDFIFVDDWLDQIVKQQISD
jgi:DNA-binding Lrp family transcriptional regulator